MTWAEYLKSKRTMTEHEVEVVAAHHDAEDFRPEERDHIIDVQTLSDLVAAPRKDHATVLSG